METERERETNQSLKPPDSLCTKATIYCSGERRYSQSLDTVFHIVAGVSCSLDSAKFITLNRNILH